MKEPRAGALIGIDALERVALLPSGERRKEENSPPAR